MVVILIKSSETDQFLFETSCAESNDALLRQLVTVWNMRLKVDLLAGALEQLAQHGPAKPESSKGIDDIQDTAQQAEGGAKPNRGRSYRADPQGNRTGEPPNEQLQQVLRKVAKDAKCAIGVDQVRAKVPTSMDLLQEKIDTMRGAVTMAYPMGLPTYDPIQAALQDEQHTGKLYGASQLDPDTAQLWWAGKEFFRDKTVGDRVGRNEKTKITAKLQAPGSGPPAREPGVTEEERKAMMAHYFKKQEQMKALAENDEDDYLNANWADSRSLKSTLNGTSNIRFR